MYKVKGCGCFYCNGYTKDLLRKLKEKIADRQITLGIEEYENRYED